MSKTIIIQATRSCSRQRLPVAIFVAAMVLSALIPALSLAASIVDVQGIRVSQASDHTQFVVELSGSVEYKLTQLRKPERIVLDLADATLRTSTKKINLKRSPVRQVRSGVQNGDDLRLVLDFTRRAENGFSTQLHSARVG